MKVKISILVLLIIFLLLPVTSETGTDRTRKLVPQEFKVKVTGSSNYLGYMNAMIYLRDVNGRPLSGQKVYLNKLLLIYKGNGFYANGTPYGVNLKGGKDLEISVIPKSTSWIKFKNESRPVRLGTFRIKNYIEWIYPKRDSTIRVFNKNVAKRTIKFRWNYPGPVLKTKIVIWNITKRTKIINKIIIAEELNVPGDMFNKGEQYSLTCEVVESMGEFKLTNATLPGSKIQFYHRSQGNIWFKVK